MGITGDVDNADLRSLSAKFMELITTQANPLCKTVDGCGVQQDIHHLQNRQQSYNNGVAVVSSDDPGVSNCIITPTTSGVFFQFSLAQNIREPITYL